jgi:hypothetical protein
MTNHLRGRGAARAIADAMLFQWEGAIELAVSESERDAAISRWRGDDRCQCPRNPRREGSNREVIAVLRSEGRPVPIELSEAAKALSRKLRPKTLRLQRLH